MSKKCIDPLLDDENSFDDTSGDSGNEDTSQNSQINREVMLRKFWILFFNS